MSRVRVIDRSDDLVRMLSDSGSRAYSRLSESAGWERRRTPERSAKSSCRCSGRRRSRPRRRRRSGFGWSFDRCGLAACEGQIRLVSRSGRSNSSNPTRSPSSTTSYVPRRTSTPIALCVSFSVAAICWSPLFSEQRFCGCTVTERHLPARVMHACRSRVVRGRTWRPRRARRAGRRPAERRRVRSREQSIR